MAPSAVPLFFGCVFFFLSSGAIRTRRTRQAFVMRAIIIAATVLHMLNNDFCLSLIALHFETGQNKTKKYALKKNANK